MKFHIQQQYLFVILMALSSFLGINFTSYAQLLLLVIEVGCFINAYYLSVILLGPLPLLLILATTLLYSRALLALHLANSTHSTVGKEVQGSRYCRRCEYYVMGRDHHCVFTGRCVEKQNYGYFVSYILYAYLLSFHTLFSILKHYPLLFSISSLELKHSIPLVIGLISSIYFLIFTGGMLASSFRSIFLGIYTVQQLKKEKQPAYTNGKIRRMWLSSQGRKTISKLSFKQWIILSPIGSKWQDRTPLYGGYFQSIDLNQLIGVICDWTYIHYQGFHRELQQILSFCYKPINLQLIIFYACLSLSFPVLVFVNIDRALSAMIFCYERFNLIQVGIILIMFPNYLGQSLPQGISQQSIASFAFYVSPALELAPAQHHFPSKGNGTSNCQQEGRGKWTKEQQKIYISFLQENMEQMDSRALRKTEKVYMKMAKMVKSRTADQCRSHHQKILKYHTSLQDIVDFYKEYLFGKQVEGEANMLRKTGEDEPSNFYRIYRTRNRFRFEIDASCVREYGE